MIKITVKSIVGSELKEPKEVFVWVQSKEKGSKNATVLLTCHGSEEDAKINMEVNTVKELHIISGIPTSEIILNGDLPLKNTLRSETHSLLVALLKENTNYSKVENLL
jgi:hypothetical protein